MGIFSKLLMHVLVNSPRVTILVLEGGSTSILSFDLTRCFREYDEFLCFLNLMYVFIFLFMFG